MSSVTYVLIAISFVLALLLALFQYKLRLKTKRSLTNISLIGLRTLSYWAIALLLINPKIKQTTYSTEKPKLAIVVDDSESIRQLNQVEAARTFLDAVKSSSDLNARFDIRYYSIGETFKQTDSFSFRQPQSLLSKAFKELEALKDDNTVAVVLTDGNQTQGVDISYNTAVKKLPIYPVILGDTVQYTDLKLSKINTNAYAFVDNQFPVEIIAVYEGQSAVKSELKVLQANKVVYKTRISLSGYNPSTVINFNLPAKPIGLNRYTATIKPLDTEKNKQNNTQDFAVEVLNQRSKIGIISAILHPDLGALKKSIETNKQREVVLLTPENFKNQLTDLKGIILYQPNKSFKSVFEELNRLKIGSFIIAGSETDVEFLNKFQPDFQIQRTQQTADYQATLNAAFNTFIVDDFNFNDYPPLKGLFGQVSFKVPNTTLLQKKINGIGTNNSLLSTYTTNETKHVLLLADGLWKWRQYNYVIDNNFKAFDVFIDKLIQFITLNTLKTRLSVDYKSFYNANTASYIKAQYFNANFELDMSMPLTLQLKNTSTKSQQFVTMFAKQTYHQYNLNNLEAGDYTFKIQTQDKAIQQSGAFTIIPFNLEAQFLNANRLKLKQLASESNTEAYFVNDYSKLFSTLLASTRFKPIQKENQEFTALINWEYFLFIIALFLTLEWLLRKYNGLI